MAFFSFVRIGELLYLHLVWSPHKGIVEIYLLTSSLFGAVRYTMDTTMLHMLLYTARVSQFLSTYC